MDDIRKLTDRISVAPFVPPTEVRALAGRFGMLINNRFDDEEPGQASSAEIESAARAAGMDYAHIPVAGGQITKDDIEAFAKAISRAEGAVLAFCRSGTRSTLLWALSEAAKRGVEDIIATAKAAGYDLTALAPVLEQRARGIARKP